LWSGTTTTKTSTVDGWWSGAPDGLTTAHAKAPLAERAPTRWLAWLVPLTAAAAAIAIWVAVPRGPAREPQPSAAGQTQLADRRAPEVVEPGARQQSADAKDSQTQPAAKSDQPSRDQAQAELRKESTRRELDSLKQASQPADADAVDRADKLRAKEPAAVAPETPVAAAAPAAPSPTARALQEQSANSAAQKVAPGVVATLAVTSPWRISGTTLERSTDGGSTWRPVSTGVTSELTAVSSPSNAVCWVVGRRGVVLRTTDGQNFSRIAFPEITDLSAVQAADAQSARVTASDGRVFTTTDGGATWHVVP